MTCNDTRDGLSSNHGCCSGLIAVTPASYPPAPDEPLNSRGHSPRSLETLTRDSQFPEIDRQRPIWQRRHYFLDVRRPSFDRTPA